MRNGLLGLILGVGLLITPATAKNKEYSLYDFLSRVSSEEFVEGDKKEDVSEERKSVSIKDNDGNFLPDCNNYSTGFYPQNPDYRFDSYIDQDGVWHIINSNEGVGYINLVYDINEDVDKKKLEFKISSPFNSKAGKIQLTFNLNNSKKIIFNMNSDNLTNSTSLLDSTLEYTLPLNDESTLSYTCWFSQKHLCEYFPLNPPDVIQSLEVSVFVMPQSSYEIEYEME